MLFTVNARCNCQRFIGCSLTVVLLLLVVVVTGNNDISIETSYESFTSLTMTTTTVTDQGKELVHVGIHKKRELQQLQQESSVSITVSTNTSTLFQPINVSISSNINQQINDNNLRLIVSSQLPFITSTTEAETVLDYLDHSSETTKTKRVYYPYNDTSIGTTTVLALAIDYTKLIGKKFSWYYYANEYDQYVLRKSSFNTTTDVTIWDDNTEYLSVLLDTTNKIVLGTSNPFTIFNDIDTVKLDRTLYFYGQTMQVTTTTTTVESFHLSSNDYYAIFRIPELLKDVPNTSSKFNNSTLVSVHYRTSTVFLQ